jgi:palmitoyltransferase
MVGIGQCVGAQNQKFFFVFVVWAAFFSLWTFTTLLALNLRAITRTEITVDAEQVVMIVLYAPPALFLLSTPRISQV